MDFSAGTFWANRLVARANALSRERKCLPSKGRKGRESTHYANNKKKSRLRAERLQNANEVGVIF